MLTVPRVPVSAVLISCVSLAIVFSGGCSSGSSVDASPDAVLQPAINSAGPQAPAADSAPDWHALALAARDMNAPHASGLFAAPVMRPQQPVDLNAELKGPSSTAEVLPGLLAPGQLVAQVDAGNRTAAAYSEDDLIKDGAEYEIMLPWWQVSPFPTPDVALSLNSNADPEFPDRVNCAYATYRFNLEGYPAAGEALSIGTLWTEESAPTNYYIGLGDWNADSWDWFRGSNDNVVTLADMAPYISGSGSLLAVVVVLDAQSRSLELLQIGAQEVRAYGGLPSETEAGLDFNGPELYYPGKSTSDLSGAPSQLQLSIDKLGYAYDQGVKLQCTACAVSGAYNYVLSDIYEPYWHTYHPRGRISPKYIYNNIYFGNYGVGRRPEDALDWMMDNGCATEYASPYNQNEANDWDPLYAPIEAGHLKITDWKKIGGKGQKGIDEVKYALSYWGLPVVFLITLSPNFDDYGDPAEGIYTWDDWVPNLLKWHSMLITGYDDSKQAFNVRNSWGYDWGNNGDVWVSYDTFFSGAWIDCFVLWDEYNEATGDYFQVNDEANIRPPANIEASDGDYLDRIEISWSEVPFATEYGVYRDDKEAPIAYVAAPTLTYTDTSADADFTHTYWIQTWKGDDFGSPITQFDTGWRRAARPPVIQDIRQSNAGDRLPGDINTYTANVYNPEYDTLSFAWTFDPASIEEASPITARNAAVTYANPGTYQGSLNVSSVSGSHELDFSYKVLTPLQQPVAYINGPSSYPPRKVAYFDGSASTTEAGFEIIEYQWEYTGDGNIDLVSTNDEFGHIFTSEGDYIIELRVKDSRGALSEWDSYGITIERYNEREDNDDMDDSNPNLKVLLSDQVRSGSIGFYNGYAGMDGDNYDYWLIYPGSQTEVTVTLQWNTANLPNAILQAQDKDLLHLDSQIDDDGTVTINFTSAFGYTGPVYVAVIAQFLFEGSDYTITATY